MKTLDKYRQNNVFCLTATKAEMAARVMEFFRDRIESVTAIAHDPKEHDFNEFSVRVTGKVAGKGYSHYFMCDYLVRVTGTRVRVIDVENIMGQSRNVADVA